MFSFTFTFTSLQEWREFYQFFLLLFNSDCVSFFMCQFIFMWFSVSRWKISFCMFELRDSLNETERTKRQVLGEVPGILHNDFPVMFIHNVQYDFQERFVIAFEFSHPMLCTLITIVGFRLKNWSSTVVRLTNQSFAIFRPFYYAIHAFLCKQ